VFKVTAFHHYTCTRQSLMLVNNFDDALVGWFWLVFWRCSDYVYTLYISTRPTTVACRSQAASSYAHSM